MKVVITGLGAHCALGDNIESLWSAIEQGESGFSDINRFDVAPFNVKIGAIIHSDNDYHNDRERLFAYGCLAANEALRNAAIADLDRVAIVLGTCNGILGEDIHLVSGNIAKTLGLGSIGLTISTACASSAHAIGFAGDLVRRGVVDYVLAGGVDILTMDIFAGFSSLGLLSQSPCSPFSTNMGTTLGEGAAFILLEGENTAQIRGVAPLATLMGFGMSADAFHDTKPDPFGAGMARALEAALKDAGLTAESIDYLNAHGTGTAANDSAEWRAIKRVFGDYSIQLPVSSSKSFLGHAQGAAGALETVTTLMAMNHHVVPPTLNLLKMRPDSPTDPVAASKPRPHQVQHSICANAAFGGVNTALVFGKANATPQPIREPRPIGLAGVGFTLDPNIINQYVPNRELRGLDLSARLLSGAVASALISAGIRLRAPECAQIGLFVGQEHICPESVEAFGDSIKDRGINHLSASAFTRMVVNYATGVSCRLFGLKGPTATLAADPDSGLTALILGAYHLAWHEESSNLLIAAVDEPNDPSDFECGAACIFLKAESNNSAIMLTGYALANNYKEAISKALEKAYRRYDEVVPICISESKATVGLQAVIKAIISLKNDEPGPFLIFNKSMGSAGAAVVIERRVINAA